MRSVRVWPPAVRHIVAASAASPDPDVFLPVALRILCEQLGFRGAVAYRTVHNCRNVAAGVMHGFSESAAARLGTFPLHRSPALTSLCRGESLHLTHREHAQEVGARYAFELGISDMRWAFLPIRSGDVAVGLLGVFGQGSTPFGEEELAVLDLISSLIAGHLVNADRYTDVLMRTQRLEDDLRFSHALLRSAEAMAEKTDLHEVLNALAAVINSETGKRVLITLVSRDGRELGVAASSGWDETPAGSLPISALDPVLRQALVERRPAVVEGGRTPSVFGIPSGRFLAVPLIKDGTLVGNIELDEPPTDRSELSRHIRLLQGMAFEASAAIESARLYEQQRRSACLRQSLNDINATLNESIDQPGLLGPVLEKTVSAFSSEGGFLALIGGSRWTAQHVLGEPGLDEGDDLPPADVANARQALRTGSPVLLATGDRERQSASGDEPLACVEGPLVLVIPLQLGQRPIGAIFVRRRNWVEALDSETLDFATKLGASVSLALGNRYLYEHEHLVAETLQQALVSIPDVVPGLDVAHLYRSAFERTRVGGDFYDVFGVGGSKVALVIGDVSGKGIDAAALTALAKNTIKAHAVEGLAPSEVLERTNEVLYKFSTMETFVTVFYGVLDTDSGALTYSNGGHPPPLICGGSGIRELVGEGTMLGAFTGSAFGDGEGLLWWGERLLFYTDGIIEARNADAELYGEERLHRLLATRTDIELAQWPATIMAEIEGFTASPLGDDAALLMVALRERRHGARKGRARRREQSLGG